MALFQKSSEKSAAKDRDDAQANVARLAGKLSEAEVAIIAAKGLAQLAALSGDDGGLDAAEAAEHTAQRRHGTITAALAESKKLLTLLESQIAEVADKKQRSATAAEVEALAADIEQAAESFDIAISALSAITAKIAPFVSEARGLEAFSASSKIEVPSATTIIASLLREHGRAVLRGEAAATLPTPEAPFVPTIPAKPVNDAPPHEPPIQFERVHRGPSYQLRVAGGTS
jgi:hypothetical protein